MRGAGTIQCRGRAITALAAAIGTLALRAAEKDWKSTVGSGNWTTGGNWVQGVAPVAGDAPFILNNDATNRVVTYNYTGAAITLGSFRVDNTGTGTNTVAQSAGVLSFGSANIGLNGHGSYVQSGGTVNASFIEVGQFSGAVGAYNLSGGQLNSPDLFVGDQGSGTFIQNGSGHVLLSGTNSTEGLYLGVSGSAVGSYTLGGNSVLTVVNNTYVGFAATGSFTQNSGTQTIGTALFVGNQATSSGTYQMNGGVLTVFNDSEYVGNSGTGVFNQTGGTNTIVSGGLQLGANANATGTYNLSNTANLSVNGTVLVGNAGAGIFNQSDGSHATLNALVLGSATGATGTYSLGNLASLSAVDEIVTEEGSGVFNQTGGSNTVSEILDVAEQVGSAGTYNLSGSGSLTSAAERVGLIGTGTFNQSGGNNVAGSLVLGLKFSAHGTYNLSNSASLTINGDEILGFTGPGTFNQTGGNHSVSGTLTVSLNPGFGSTGVFNLLGGTLSANVIQLNSGGTFNRTGGTLSFTNFNMSGGTVTGILPNPGTFTYTSGTFAGRLVNQGTLNLGPNFTAGNGIENDVGWTLNSGTVVLNGAGLDNEGTLIIAGGTLVLSTNATNLNNGTLGFASASPFHLNANLQNGGTINLNGSAWDGAGTLSNVAGGTITGYGTLGANFPLNAGTIIPVGGTLNVPGALTNVGLIQGVPSGTLSAQNVVNNGQINQTAGNATMTALSGTGSLTVGGAGAALVNVSSFSQQSLSILSGGTVRVSLSTTLATNVANTLSITGGSLDLANSNLITSTASNTIQQYLKAGYNGGQWNGTGAAAIVSSPAAAAFGSSASRSLGMATADDQASGRVAAGNPALSAGQTLVKYTVPGDANLSGTVDFADFSALQTHYRGQGDWTQGDWDYSGTVDFGDFAILQTHYRQSLGANGSVAHANVAKAQTLTSSSSPTVTYVLSKNDDGSGSVSLGKYAVYAIESGGDGLAAYSVGLDGDGGVANAAPSSFSLLREADGRVAGAQDTISGSGTSGQMSILVATGSLTSSLGFDADNALDLGNVFGSDGSVQSAAVSLVTRDLAAVPEPASLALLGVAGVGMLSRRKRRK